MLLTSMQESIVKQLEQRYKNDIIYTYIGDILLAINPFFNIDIYSEKVNSLHDASDISIRQFTLRW